MRIKISAIAACFFIIFISSAWAENAASVSTAPLKTLNGILELIQKFGNEVRSNSQFYQSVNECYYKQLNSIIYFNDSYKDKNSSYLLLYNDKNGVCIFSSVPVNIIPQQEMTGSICKLTPDQIKKMLTPWYRDAITYYDQTKQANQLFREFILKVRQCAKPAALEDILFLLQSSTQTQPKAP